MHLRSGTLQCKAGDDATCLTAAQVKAARTLYSPLVDAKTTRETAGLQRGSELGWTNLGWTASARATGLDQFRFIVVKDPTWEVDRFNAQTDLGRADAADDGLINALDVESEAVHRSRRQADSVSRMERSADLAGQQRPVLPARSSKRWARARSADAYRLFVVPGMGHCRGGEGPNAFDVVAALEQWVEQKKAPDQIVAAHSTNGTVDRTRPLCPYPQVAKYSGSGSLDDAANFSCKLP